VASSAIPNSARPTIVRSADSRDLDTNPVLPFHGPFSVLSSTALTPRLTGPLQQQRGVTHSDVRLDLYDRLRRPPPARTEPDAIIEATTENSRNPLGS